MSNHSKTLSESTILSLLDDFKVLSEALRRVRRSLLKAFPAKYGSDVWWEKAIAEGTESIRNGKGKKFDTYDKAVQYLNS